MNLGSAVAILALFSGLVAAGTVIALGFQRGRVQRLEAAASDLRKDLGDEKERRKVALEDLASMRLQATTYHDEVVTLRAQVETMTRVMHGVEGPIAQLNANVERTNQLIESHNQAAMGSLGELRSMQLDALQLLGDGRSRNRIRAEARKDDPSAEPS